MKKIYLLFLFITILFACNKDDNEPDSPENQNQTFVIAEANITNVGDNSIILTNPNGDLEVNDIIVSGANANAPKGFLRKITGISTENGTATLTTERTSLEEGLKYFPDSEIREATFSHTFTDIDETGGKDLNKRGFSLILEIDESVTVNNTQLTLNGTLEITPTINGQIIIGRNVLGFPVLDTIELLTETQNNLTITIGSETNGSFDEEVTIGSFQGPPITVYLGGFPVVINPTVSLSVGANGQVNATLSYSYNNNSTIRAGILYYEDWQFPATNGFVVNSSNATATANVTGNAKAYIKPEFGISLYDEGFVNTGINIKPYARFEGSISNSGYNYGIYGGISAGAYFNATLFGFSLIDKEWDDLITFAEYEIDSGSTSTTYIADLNPLNGTTVTQQPINLSWVPYGFTETPTYEVLFGTAANQLISVANTIDNFYTLTQTYLNGQYFWKIIARNSANVIIAESEVQNFILNVNIDLPTVTTTAISNITENSALSGGNVTAGGGSSVSVKGVCWSTNPNPTTANNTTTNGSGLGAFTSQLTGLSGNTTYYVRAYATNNFGTAYGNQVSFNTEGSGNVSPAYNPNPADGATNIPLTGTLSFTPGTNTPANATFKLYFGTNPNPTTSYNLGASTNYNYNSLQENTNYYWKIETISSSSQVLATSGIWGFKSFNSSGGGTYTGDVVLTTQQEVNDFGSNNYSSINGWLFIYGATINDLSSLGSLLSISGLLTVQGTQLVNLNGLNNITETGGLNIRNTTLLQNLNGLNNITTVNGLCEFANNSALTNINDLSNLNFIEGRLYLYHNISLTTINGLGSLTTINGYFNISDNDNLITLNGLENLISVGENLDIRFNDGINNFCALQNILQNNGVSGVVIDNNSYNPTVQDIIDGNCSQ